MCIHFLFLALLAVVLMLAERKMLIKFVRQRGTPLRARGIFFPLSPHSQVNAAGVIARSAVADLHTFKKAHKVSSQSAAHIESAER